MAIATAKAVRKTKSRKLLSHKSNKGVELPLNVFLIPLLGGYLFASRWNVTQWYSDRWEKERLLLNSATYGLLCYFAALLIIRGQALWPCVSWLPCLPRWPESIPPFDYLGVSLLACVIGFLSPTILNLYFTKQKTNKKLIKEEGTLFEILLDSAMRNSRTVMITLKGGKVYVGFPISFPAPGRAQPMIQILQTLSGYREADKHRVVFTTNYSRALDEIHHDCDEMEIQIAKDQAEITALEDDIATLSADSKEEHKRQLSAKRKRLDNLHESLAELERTRERLSSSIEDFGILIPVDQIASMTLYHASIHSKYFAHTDPPDSPH